MKALKYILIAILAVSPLALSSCLKDQKDIFDESASVRMQNYLSEAQKTLMDSEYGWELDYYPDRRLRYGGYVFTVKFNDTTATVGSILSPGTTETSYYKMNTDNGPMLSFDTYNSLMHYFATPSGSSDRYEAWDGDFEFVIDSVTTDLVKIHGKRSGNIMYFRKLTKDPQEYIAATDSLLSELYVTGGEGTIGGTPIVLSFDYETNRATFTAGDESVEVSFTVIENGLRFYTPVTIANKTFTELPYSPADFAFSGTCLDGTEISMVATLPEGYVKFSEYAGDYWMHYNRTSSRADSCRVTLTPGDDGKSFIMSGLNDNYTVTLNFLRTSGRLEWNSQKIGEYGGYQIWLCAWGIGGPSGGTLTWSTSAGMVTTWNGDSENPVYTFETNDYTGLVTTSYIMWKLNSSGSNAGGFSGVPSWRINNNTYRIYYLKNLTKIN